MAHEALPIPAAETAATHPGRPPARMPVQLERLVKRAPLLRFRPRLLYGGWEGRVQPSRTLPGGAVSVLLNGIQRRKIFIIAVIEIPCE